MWAISQSLPVDTSRHCGRNLQGLMDAHKIVMHEIDRHHVLVVFGFL